MTKKKRVVKMSFDAETLFEMEDGRIPLAKIEEWLAVPTNFDRMTEAMETAGREYFWSEMVTQFL
jgi:hypothetical protein